MQIAYKMCIMSQLLRETLVSLMVVFVNPNRTHPTTITKLPSPAWTISYWKMGSIVLCNLLHRKIWLFTQKFRIWFVWPGNIVPVFHTSKVIIVWPRWGKVIDDMLSIMCPWWLQEPHEILYIVQCVDWVV